MEFLWDNLVCKCGSISFIAPVEIRWKQASGTIIKPTGKYICTECRVASDPLTMIQAKEVQQKEKELESLLAQV